MGFLAHISTELIDDSDYEVDEKLNPIRLKRIDDLYNHIIKNKELITEPIKISLVIGTNPIKEDSKAKVLILEAINDLIFKLKALGISVYYDGEFYQSSFIFDTTNHKFILPDKKVKL